MEIGEVIYEKVYASPRPPPKISLKHDWMKELGSEVAQRPDGQVVGQGNGVPKAGQKQAVTDSQGSRTCVCANTFDAGVAHEKGKLTSCRGTVWSVWQKPPVRRKGGRAGLPARVSGRHVLRGRQSSPILEVRPSNRLGW